MTSFSISFYRGDTPTLVVSLDIHGQEQSLNGHFAKLYIQQFQIDADIQGTNACFFINKDISEDLSIGAHKAWIEIASPQTKYSYQGVIRVERARV